MASVVPAGYVFWDDFGYVRESDRTGPYAIDGTGTPTLIGSAGGGPEALDFGDPANSQYLALPSVGGM